MAVGEGKDGSNKITSVLRNLEADVTCGICYEQYRKPKLLPCGHYFCRRCVKQVANQKHGKPFRCPICQEITTLPPQGVDELPSAYFVEHLLEVHRAIDANKEELRGPRKLTCDDCKGEGVTSFCKECDQFLCNNPCLEKHQSKSIYAQHQLMSIAELRAKRRESSRASRNMSILGRSDSIASYIERPFVRSQESLDEKGKVYQLCAKHPGEPIKVYCHTHDMLICRDCTVYEHRDCDTGFVREEAPKSRRALEDALVPVHDAHQNILAAERDVEAVHDRVCSHEIEQIENVRRLFEDIHTRVNHCQEVLLGEIKTVSQGKKEALTSQRKAIQISNQEIESTIDSVKQDINDLTDDEILTTQRQLEMKIQKEQSHHRLRKLEPTTFADLVRIGPTIGDFPTKKGLAFPREDQRHLRITPPEKIFVGVKVDYKIHIPYSIGEDVEVEVQSLVDEGCVIRAVVIPWRERDVTLRGVVVARYDVMFTPRVRGPHRLTTKINGEELPGSPFSNLFALIEPTHLGFIIRQSEEAGKPYGIAITHDGLLVTASNGSKSLRFWSRHDMKEVVKENDKKEPVMPVWSEMFHYPRGVAAGAEEGIVYSTDKGVEKSRSYTIMKFVNGKLQRWSTYGSRNVRLMKIIKDQLFVADERNSQVHRFSPENLDHIGTFNSKASDTHDMAMYNNHLYVLGSTQIAMYSFGDWRFVGHVPIKGVTLSLMRGIAFDKNGYMFITQAGSGVEGVYVFRPTGEFITSFGHHMEHPCGIVIDDDGFVYVCDHKKADQNKEKHYVRRIYVF